MVDFARLPRLDFIRPPDAEPVADYLRLVKAQLGASRLDLDALTKPRCFMNNSNGYQPMAVFLRDVTVLVQEGKALTGNQISMCSVLQSRASRSARRSGRVFPLNVFLIRVCEEEIIALDTLKTIGLSPPD